MKKLARIFFGLSGLALLAIALLPFSEEHAAATQPMPVAVTNTPLPVQGTVSVGNTASVNVSNTPSVNVANAPNVNVMNSALAISNALNSSNNPVPLLVDHRIEPIEASCQLSSGVCNFGGLIPAGKILVIQEFAAEYISQSGNTVLEAWLQAGWSNSQINHFFGLTTNGTDSTGAVFKAVHQQTTIYVDGGVGCSGFSTAGFSGFSGTCTISGYLIPQ